MQDSTDIEALAHLRIFQRSLQSLTVIITFLLPFPLEINHTEEVGISMPVPGTELRDALEEYKSMRIFSLGSVCFLEKGS